MIGFGRVVAVLAGLFLAGPAAAAETPVDLELVLAVDASRSIDGYEYGLQREGYAKALTHPEVIRAITSGILRRIAVAYVEWSGEAEQATLIAWSVIDGPAAAKAFAKSLMSLPRRYADGTGISHAIDYAAGLFAGNGIEGTRRVIDVSGDGPNNRGRPTGDARDDAVGKGITINGLAILNDRPSRPPWPEQPVDLHYRDHLIGGPGAFMITIDDFKDFADGIRKKLILEIAGARPDATLAASR